MEEKVYMDTIEMLAATIAHEVKNPLSLIQANIDYLELCDEQLTFNKNYKTMKEQVKKANDMIACFVDLVKSTYRLDEMVAVFDVVTDVLEKFQQTMFDTTTITFECSDKNVYCEGNYHLLSIAISNIVKNAIEALDSKGEILVSLNADAENVCLTVKDNGTGLCEKLQGEQSFEECYTSKSGGSGVGLKACKQIITQHGGEFSIRDNEIKGCVATIVIPLAK